MSLLTVVYDAKLSRLNKEKPVCTPEMQSRDSRKNKTSKQKFSGLEVKGTL